MQRTGERLRLGYGARVATLIVAVVVLAGCVAAPKVNVAPVQSGVDIPWDVGWLPNRTMLFTQRANGLTVVLNGQRRVIWKPADLLVASEAGMMSLAVDYSYATTRRVFVCFASRAGAVADVRIARLTLNAAATAVTGRSDIVTGIPVNPVGQLGRHSGCRLRFGFDGYLWVGTGDAATGTAPQDPHSLGGKVLRIDRNGAAARTGNMTAPFDPRIQSYGHRNVQGLAFRSNGQVFAVEHGPGCDDEVNLLKTGANYGWDPVPRKAGDPAYNENTPMTDRVHHPFATKAVYSSGCPTIAPSGGTFVYGAQWGAWNGGLVMAVLKDSHLRMLQLSADGTKVVAVSVALTDRGRLRTATIGPDGALYVTTSNGFSTDFILRLAPAAARA
jgi:glucose/arabinose dehydrogenase